MGSLRQSLRRIPFWAYFLVFTVICVDTIYLIYRYQGPYSGETGEPVNGHWIINYSRAGGPVDRSGIKVGDTLISCNGYPVEKWVESYHGTKARDTLIFGILRNNQEVGIPVIVGSKMNVFPGLYWSTYIVVLLVSICSLYLVFKKPEDYSTRLFFIYIQLYAIAAFAGNIIFTEWLFVFANLTYIFCMCLLGPVLIHFHLLFPRPLLTLSRTRIISMIIYFLGAIIFIYSTISHHLNINPFSGTKFQYNILDRLALFWMTLTFIWAMGVVVFQFVKVKSTLSRNQMLIIFTGSFFGFFTPIVYGLFYDYINRVASVHVFLLPLSDGIGSIIMICCILIAIFRYRIWDVEVIIRKVFLYIGATMVIMLTYLLMIWFVDRLTVKMTDLTRFLIMGISVIIFLLSRDRIQQLIDRLFHRETYDSATVVSDFEAKLAGIYRLDELKQKIVLSIDDIFHFKSFGFILKKNGLVYEPVFAIGINDQQTGHEFEVGPPFEERLKRLKVFSPQELDVKSAVFDSTGTELIIPLVSDKKPQGFFVCGQKKSERIYSQQDISVLSLLAGRVIALLHTATLYQRDLDRQLLLERERARISQDMHDDIGAGLTKIAMISEAPVKSNDKVNESGERMARVASSAREMISRLNVIIWALNPKNDNIDSLIAYSRRYFGEYLENLGISFKTELPEMVPEISLSPDSRRNIFYSLQEAIHNAVKHGVCSEITFFARVNGQNLEMKIYDNGKGFDTGESNSTGNGIINMKKRAQDLSGYFSINSLPGKGTEVSFLINIPQNTTKGGL